MAVTELVYFFFKRLIKIFEITGIKWIEACDNGERVYNFNMAGMKLKVEEGEEGGGKNETGIWDYVPKTNELMMHYAGNTQVYKIISLNHTELIVEDMANPGQRSLTNENYLLPESYSPEFALTIPVIFALVIFILSGMIVPALVAFNLL